MDNNSVGVNWDSGSAFHARCARQMALLSCIKARDVITLDEIISLVGFDPDEIFSQDRESCNALCMAVAHDWPEGLSALICAGADVNKPAKIVECWFGSTHHLLTPLMSAILFSHLECLSLLLQHGSDTNYLDPYGLISMLHLAAYTNNTESVKLLMTRANVHDVNHMGDDVKFTALRIAVANMGYRLAGTGFPIDPAIVVEGDKEKQTRCLTVMELLLAAGAMFKDPAYSGRAGYIPVPFLCATVTDTRVMELFLRYGLDVNMTSKPITIYEHSFNNLVAGPCKVDLSRPLSLLTYYLLAGYLKVACLLVEFGASCLAQERQLILAAAQDEVHHGTSGILTNQWTHYIRMLRNHVTNAPTLSWQCKKIIRGSNGVNTEKAINNLPLPTLLRLYLQGLT